MKRDNVIDGWPATAGSFGLTLAFGLAFLAFLESSGGSSFLALD